LQAMFGQLGDAADAATCETMAAVAAQTIANLWTKYQGPLGYLPALLDGSDTSAIIPMVEGLAYPLEMGLTNAVDRTGGPYASMLLALSNHLEAVLVRGLCLDATSGAWDMTSASGYGNSPNTWQSKMYIAQYAAERVLGLTGNNVNGTVDQIHATIQFQNAAIQEWSDQLDGTGADLFVGSTHYPRGITSALWWLNATNNPGYPVPSTGTNITAVVSGKNLTVSWPSNYVGWILQTNAVDVGNSFYWGDMPGSGTNSRMTFPTTNPTFQSEFFRLRYPF